MAQVPSAVLLMGFNSDFFLSIWQFLLNARLNENAQNE
jgi:hypothetical protein